MRALISLCLTACLALLGGCGDDGGGAGGDGGVGNDGGGNGDGGGNNNGDGGNPKPTACKKVDLVFSLDGSGSMVEEQDAMANEVFPAFAEALLNIGDGLDDYRVGVLDACPKVANFHTRGKSGECNFQSGEVWMTSESSALETEFQCVGNIYIGDYVSSDNTRCTGNNDDDEAPIKSIIASLTEPFIGRENAGFLRDDALLVVIAITDEDEEPTISAPADELYQQLVDIKGDVRKIVFLGIGGATDCRGAYGNALAAPRVRGVADRFIAEERGVFWDLCQGMLEDGLTEAMEVIETACEELPPIVD